MGPQYQAIIDSYAASPQATQSAGNQTLGKAMEQSPLHDGFGTGSSMYDNDMGKGYQPAPVAQPPQPQNQPSSAGINPSWAQQTRNRGGRTGYADGGAPIVSSGGPGSTNPQGMYAAFQNVAPAPTGLAAATPPSMMMGGDWLANWQARPDVQAAQKQIADQQADIAKLQQTISPPVPTATSTNPNVANDTLLTNLYKQYLGRLPDLEGEKFWSGLIEKGTLTPQQASDYISQAAEVSDYNDRVARAEQVGDLGQALNQWHMPAAMRNLGATPSYGQQVNSSYYNQLLNRNKAQSNIANQQYQQTYAKNLGDYYNQLVNTNDPAWQAAMANSGNKLTPEQKQKMINDREVLKIINKVFNTYYPIPSLTDTEDKS